MVVKFTLLNGKYFDESGNEITTDMMMKYPHKINKNKGKIYLPDKFLSPNESLVLSMCENIIKTFDRYFNDNYKEFEYGNGKKDGTDFKAIYNKAKKIKKILTKQQITNDKQKNKK